MMVAEKPNIKPWVIHDLRRTATTRMAKIQAQAPHVVDKILNHVSGTISGVAGIYNKEQYLAERTETLEQWATYVKGLVVQR
jgi:integrase